MSEVRLINANALYREVKTECNPYGKPTIGFDDGKKVLKLIDAAPTIEAEPVRHGRWIEDGEICGIYKYKCSLCGGEVGGLLDNTKYCCFCGAKMDGVSEDETD